jgi:hypothetical protein
MIPVREIEHMIAKLDRAKRDLQLELLKHINEGAKRREANSTGESFQKGALTLNELRVVNVLRGLNSGVRGTLCAQDDSAAVTRKRLEMGLLPSDPTIKRVTLYSDRPIQWSSAQQGNWESSGRHNADSFQGDVRWNSGSLRPPVGERGSVGRRVSDLDSEGRKVPTVPVSATPQEHVSGAGREFFNTTELENYTEVFNQVKELLAERRRRGAGALG